MRTASLNSGCVDDTMLKVFSSTNPGVWTTYSAITSPQRCGKEGKRILDAQLRGIHFARWHWKDVEPDEWPACASAHAHAGRAGTALCDREPGNPLQQMRHRARIFERNLRVGKLTGRLSLEPLVKAGSLRLQRASRSHCDGGMPDASSLRRSSPCSWRYGDANTASNHHGKWSHGA